MVKHKSNAGKWEKEKGQCVQFIRHANSSITHLHITCYSSGSMSPLRAYFFPVVQTELEDWPKRPYPEPLIK